MAKPRIFISSTYYDLKHIRSSIDLFIESLGFEPVLSEKGNIAYTPDMSLDKSCYREATKADIFVLIIGGRYGTEISSDSKKTEHEFFEKYESVTKKEYESAAANEIPVYILIESNVHSEYQTYLRNKDSEISYAHVDSVNIFKFIEDILSKQRNNPIHTFERFSDIESWLREQWSGLFREMLQQKVQQGQLTDLKTQISKLQEANQTLQRYIEAIMSKVVPQKSSKLISSEKERLLEVEKRNQIRKNRLFLHLACNSNIDLDDFIRIVTKAKSFTNFIKSLESFSESNIIWEPLSNSHKAKKDFKEVRELLGLEPINK